MKMRSNTIYWLVFTVMLIGIVFVMSDTANAQVSSSGGVFVRQGFDDRIIVVDRRPIFLGDDDLFFGEEEDDFFFERRPFFFDRDERFFFDRERDERPFFRREREDD